MGSGRIAVNRRGVPTPIGVANLLISLGSEGSKFGAYSQQSFSVTIATGTLEIRAQGFQEVASGTERNDSAW